MGSMLEINNRKIQVTASAAHDPKRLARVTDQMANSANREERACDNIFQRSIARQQHYTGRFHDLNL
jgi:hypothetical protein